MATQYNVTFLPHKKSGYFKEGTSLWQAALELGIHSIDAECGGLGKCGKCLVYLRQGRLQSTELEEKALDLQKEPATRLACQAQIVSDVVVEIPVEEEPDTQVILADGETSFAELKPAVTKTFVELEKPQLEKNPFDLEDLKTSVNFTLAPLNVMQKLPQTLRASDYKVTAVCHNHRLVDVEQNNTLNQLFGIAVDVGTTTIVAKLIDLNQGHLLAVESQLNAQRQFGEDVVSRISYASEQKNGLHTLQATIIEQLNQMIETLTHNGNIHSDRIYEMVIAGNATMEHLLLGVLPKYMAEYPYVPVFRGPVRVRASELDLNIHENGEIYLLPNIGRFVGGDTVAVLLTLANRFKGSWLMIDVGTNGELVLFHQGEMIACSTAAGPALEGAHISCGMRASNGAVDHIDVDEDDFIIHVIGETKARGICGSGIIDAVGACLKAGLIDQTGRIPDPEELGNNLSESMQKRVISDDEGKYIHFDQVRLVQKDIRELQLAKSAIASGIEILLKQYQLQVDDLDAIYLAGAFGQFIRPEMAQKIGLLPAVDLDKVQFIGNAAYAGAELALSNREFKKMAIDLVEKIRYLEISTDLEFQTLFAENMLFNS